MQITRRQLLQLITGSAAALAVDASQLGKLQEALASALSPPVLWLQGSACTGCSISLLNATNPTIDAVLLDKVSLKYHPDLSSAAGDLAIGSAVDAAHAESGKFILVVEGGIPTGAGGKTCVIGRRNGADWTMRQAVTELGPMAKYVVAVGTCASFGGIAKRSSYTAVKTVREILAGKTASPVVNLPGCPAHPNAMIGTLVTLLTTGMPALDSSGRPKAYYSGSVHSQCPRREADDASGIGSRGCFEEFGCKGPDTVMNCPSHKWNNGVNWCINGNIPCIGCASASFPANPLYRYAGGGGD
jgi:hydrogenase small subunit